MCYFRASDRIKHKQVWSATENVHLVPLDHAVHIQQTPTTASSQGSRCLLEICDNCRLETVSVMNFASMCTGIT